MGYVPGFQYDIFISYAHMDNEPLLEGEQGWISLFESLLRNRLQNIVGAQINIFRDQRLNGFEEFPSQLAEALTSSAVFICILSPRYIKAPWCLKELRIFRQHTGGGRLIKVVKTAIEGKTADLDGPLLLAQIKDLIEHRFYKEDPTTDRLVYLQPEVDREDLSSYVDKIDDICADLDKLFRRLRNETSTSETLKLKSVPTTAPMPGPGLASSATPQLTVYLAQTSKDLELERRDVRRELKQFNYRVLPEQPFPQDVDQFAAAVSECLEQCQLAVHMLGAEYGSVLDGEERSISHVQYDLAAECARAGKLSQMVWVPIGLALKSKRQSAFVSAVKKSPDFLLAKLEDLKTEIRNKLEQFARDAHSHAGKQTTVYLAATAKDLSELRNLIAQELTKLNCRILPDQPLPQDAEQFSPTLRQYLEQAQFAVHLFGASYGLVLDGEERSIPHLQYDLAVAQAQAGKLTQLVLLAEELTPKPGSQQEEFVTSLKQQHPPELVLAKLNDLVAKLQLSLLPPGFEDQAEAAEDSIQVSILCHENDLNAVTPLYNHLSLTQRFTVSVLPKEGGTIEKRKERLQASDAVLVYYGVGDEVWFGNCWRVMQKFQVGRNKPLLVSAIYIGREETVEKDLLNSTDDPLVLKNYRDFTPQALEPFLKQIQSGRGGQP